jgi:hypothetical protein
MDALAENGPRPILIARESIPPEYWNGLPQNLALRLQGEKDPQQIIADIYAYRAEEMSHARRGEPLAATPQQVPWNGRPAPSPMDDYLEKQRNMQEQARAQSAKLLHPDVPLAETPIRFVPAATIQGRPFLIAPETPSFPGSQTAQQTPALSTIEKGNP